MKEIKPLIFGVITPILFVSIIISFVCNFFTFDKRVEDYKKDIDNASFAEFNTFIEKGKIKTVFYEKDNSIFFAEKNSKSIISVANPEYDTFKKDLLDKAIDVKPLDDINALIELKVMYKYFFVFGLLCVLFGVSIVFFSKSLNLLRMKQLEKTVELKEVGDSFANVMKTDMDINNNIDINDDNNSYDIMQTKKDSYPKFKDVAGLHEVKKDVQCLVDFLKHKDKYTSAGAKLPRGVIFYGPPGTGKTLLAKAIANEANVPFHYMSGSDFVEMYVGVGAKRIRQLFSEAKKTAPCIIFIDEIDAIGGKRDNEASHAEDRKTINALLTEMDGFESSENIIVIGATNQINSLDEALLRPGRFTNKYCIPLPCSATERREVIDIYAKNKKFAKDVNFNNIAKETMGFSPAAIESYLNESAIISVQDKKSCIDKESLDKALVKILLSGHIKENQKDRDKEELKTVAWHEAGHALIGKLNGKEITKVTILSSTSGAGGVTFTSPKSESGLHSISDLKNEVMELYAGRIAELLCNGKSKITTGASNDIERATHIIKSIVTSFGMSEEYGLLNLNHLNVSQDIILEKEVKLAKELEKETTEILTENFEILKKIANALLENETVYDAELDYIIHSALEPALA